MNTGVDSKFHLCSDDPTPGSLTFLLLQLFNITLQQCKIDQYRDHLYLNELNEKLDNANKCWQDKVLSKIEEGSHTNLNNIKLYLQGHSPETSVSKSELEQEKRHCADLENKLKEQNAHLQEWGQHVWKFTSQETAERALFGAALSGDSSLATWLIDIGTNVNALNKNNRTPLHFAAESGHAETIQILLDRKANLNAKDKWQWAPLHFCAWGGHLKACNVLINAGAVIDIRTHDGRTPLHRAAQEGFLDVTKILLDKGANPNAKDKWEWTPLFYSAQGGHLPVCTLLVDRGAQVNARSYDRDWKGTSLVWANKNAHKAVVEYLKSKGASF